MTDSMPEEVVVAIVAVHLLVRGRGQDWTVNDDESHGFEREDVVVAIIAIVARHMVVQRRGLMSQM